MADMTTGSLWADEVADPKTTALAAANQASPIYQGELPEECGLEWDLAVAPEAINLDIGARVLTVEFGDFDTNDDHRSRHDPLRARPPSTRP